MRNPYAVLGVKESAESATIKSAYRSLAKSWHPDQNHDNPEAGSRFAEITRAYQLLINPDLRQSFDRGDIDIEGRRRQQATRNQATRNDANEIFSAFREAWRRRPKARKAKTETGTPNENVTDGLEDFDAMVKHIFGENASSADCGTGQTGQAAYDPLAQLDGLFAKWKTIHRTKPAQAENKSPLAETHATVEIDLEAVNSGAKARIRTHNDNEIDLSIPAGMADGARLHVEVNHSSGNQSVHVTIRHRRHPIFRAEGPNLHMDAAITLDEAILGGKVIINGIDGPLRVNIPEWTTGHQSLIVPGRGLLTDTGLRGDLHVHLSIRLPVKPDDTMVDFIRSRRKSLYV